MQQTWNKRKLARKYGSCYPFLETPIEGVHSSYLHLHQNLFYLGLWDRHIYILFCHKQISLLVKNFKNIRIIYKYTFRIIVLNVVHLFCGPWEYNHGMRNFGKETQIQIEHPMVISPWPITLNKTFTSRDNALAWNISNSCQLMVSVVCLCTIQLHHNLDWILYRRMTFWL